MKKSMPETEYRASRVCRILGNPTAYQVIKCLSKCTKTPTDLSIEIGVSLATISEVLRNLRNIDLVRYEVKVNSRTYWLKDRTILEIINALEKFVKRMRTKKW